MYLSQEEHRLLYRVAQAYYVDGQTQQQIARRFGMSRPKISRLLQKARDVHVVNITLVPPPQGAPDLEREMERRYDLEEVVLVSVADPEDVNSTARDLGEAAAACLLRCVNEMDVVGLAWGRTILAMVDAFPSQPQSDLTIVQLSGGLGPVGVLEHATELVRRAADKLGARLRLLPAPGIVSSVDAARALRADYQVSEVLKLAARADIAVVGLGVPTPDSVLIRDGNIVTADDLAAIKATAAVGDILLRYVDEEGRPVPLALNERIIGLSLDQLAVIPRVVGVAGGSVKREIIRAALKARLLDVLVTDQATAEYLLSI
ncbi:MAG: sugar-binding transcriptional regulator [Anaerolineae bacterium]